MKGLHHKILSKVKNDPKTIVIVVLAIVILIAAYFWFFSGNVVKIEIEDKCGRIMNLFQHTVNDASGCKQRCENLCISMKKSYKSFDFLESQAGCNECTCYCK